MRSPRRMINGSGAEIDHNDADFAAIVGVDGAGELTRVSPSLTRRGLRGRTRPESGRYFKCDSSRYRGAAAV